MGLIKRVCPLSLLVLRRGVEGSAAREGWCGEGAGHETVERRRSRKRGVGGKGSRLSLKERLRGGQGLHERKETIHGKTTQVMAAVHGIVQIAGLRAEKQDHECSETELARGVQTIPTNWVGRFP